MIYHDGNIEVGKETPNRRVLLVDDEISSALPMSAVLDAIGIESDLVFDGQSAIDGIRNNKYDMYIVDWVMPFRGGRETLLEIDKHYSNEKNKIDYKIPFLIFSELPTEEIDIPSTQNLTFVGLISKPINLAELTSVVNKHCRQVFKKI